MKTRQLPRPVAAAAAASLAIALGATAQVKTGVVPEPGPPRPVPVSPAPQSPPAPGAPAPVAAPAPRDNVDIDNIAKIPYEALIKIAQSDASQPKDADIYTLRISSKIGVPINQIELFLDRATAPEPVKIDPNGYFLVPHKEDLLKENPDLVSNQPKGSLNLEVKLSLPKPELPEIKDGRVKYQDLFKTILVLNESMRQVDPTFGETDQHQFAIEFTTGPEGWIKVQRQFGARTLMPDEQGSVWIIFEKLLFDENPEIQVMPQASPVSVRPISAAQAAEIRAK